MPAQHVSRLCWQRLAVGFEEAPCLGEQGFRGRLHHFAVHTLDDGQAQAMVFDDDIGEGAVHGAQGSRRIGSGRDLDGDEGQSQAFVFRGDLPGGFAHGGVGDFGEWRELCRRGGLSRL
jgi:hypothetical protein